MRHQELCLSALLVAAMVAPATRAETAAPTAFPGAIGYGRHATGWRGGDVVTVTNLDDAGPGSLRACAGKRGRPQGGKRVCTFVVAGTIEVSRTIFVASNTYIAGQTSPGGVQLKLGTGQATPLVVRRTHDVLIRHLALRPGVSSETSANVDGITIEDAERVYLDHLSIAFGTDENVNVHANGPKRNGGFETKDITIANSIVALGLDHANHPKGGHSKGALICSGALEVARCGRITLNGNLFAHNRDRNPDVKATATGPVEVLGNVFYNPKSQFAELYDLLGETRIAYRGNLAVAGPSTRTTPRPAAIEGFRWELDHIFEIHVDDNRSAVAPGCDGGRKPPLVDANAAPFTVAGSWTGSRSPALPSTELPGRVLANVGARTAATPSGLDPLDRRIVRDVERCSGRVIDSPEEVGGWPVLVQGSVPEDTDSDGMPDDWERARGLDPTDARDTWTIGPGARFSHLELYLESLGKRSD